MYLPYSVYLSNLSYLSYLSNFAWLTCDVCLPVSQIEEEWSGKTLEKKQSLFYNCKKMCLQL
jgi:hypothetical protein